MNVLSHIEETSERHMDDHTTNENQSDHSPTRHQVRAAKMRLIESHGDVPGVGSFGIGQTDDGSSMAVTVAVSNKATLAKMPKDIDGVPVRAYLSGPAQAF
jgi:hypothetical protein